MLLAVEAYATFQMGVIESVLRQVYARYDAIFGLMPGHQGTVYHAAFSPDGKLVVTASRDKTARLWMWPVGRRCGSCQGTRAQCITPLQSRWQVGGAARETRPRGCGMWPRQGCGSCQGTRAVVSRRFQSRWQAGGDGQWRQDRAAVGHGHHGQLGSCQGTRAQCITPLSVPTASWW